MVGLILGLTVEGEVDGFLVGLTVGFNDGTKLGIALNGKVDGLVLGMIDGKNVGVFVRLSDGIVVAGIKVGILLDGFLVGLRDVGESDDGVLPIDFNKRIDTDTKKLFVSAIFVLIAHKIFSRK